MNGSEQIHENRRRSLRCAAPCAWVPGARAALLAAVALVAGTRPSVAGASDSGRGTIVAPAVQAGLAGRWAAANDAARRNGWATYWVGWAVRVPAGTRVVSSNGPHPGDPSPSVLQLVGEGATLRLGARPDTVDAVSSTGSVRSSRAMAARSSPITRRMPSERTR